MKAGCRENEALEIAEEVEERMLERRKSAAVLDGSTYVRMLVDLYSFSSRPACLPVRHLTWNNKVPY